MVSANNDTNLLYHVMTHRISINVNTLRTSVNYVLMRTDKEFVYSTLTHVFIRLYFSLFISCIRARFEVHTMVLLLNEVLWEVCCVTG